MAQYTDQVFQNHLIHHPLLQYQMLFPSILMSLGAPPYEGENEDPMLDAEGKVNSIDYLRFSALANQLAITQINQVLIDIVNEAPNEDLKGLKDLQKSFMEVTKSGFAQLHRQMLESKSNIQTNNQIILKQDEIMTKVQNMVSEGFRNSVSEMEEIQVSIKNETNQTLSSAQEVKGMLSTISTNIEKLQSGNRNITVSSVNCITNVETGSQRNTINTTQSTESSTVLEEILSQIQNDLKNLTLALENFISSSKDAAAAERESLMSLKEYCSNATSAIPDLDLSNITRKIEESIATQLKEIQPQMQNLTEDFGKFDATILETKEALAANMSRAEADLQNLKKLTERGFADLHSKIESLSLSSPVTQATNDCPDGYFHAGKECFYLSIQGPLNREDAALACENRNEHLADPTEILDFIFMLRSLEFNASSGVWLGGEAVVVEKVLNAEAPSYQEPEWKWMPSGDKIDHGWNVGYPRKLADSCLFFISQGFQNGDCEEDRDYVCKEEKK